MRKSDDNLQKIIKVIFYYKSIKKNKQIINSNNNKIKRHN